MVTMDDTGENNSFTVCTNHLGLAKFHTIVLGILIACALLNNISLVRCLNSLTLILTLHLCRIKMLPWGKTSHKYLDVRFYCK